jgi:hypothetical protein
MCRVQYIEPSKMTSFRQSCARASLPTIAETLRPFFATWSTSLIGSDLEQLISLATDDHLRALVETLIIEDDCQRVDPWDKYEIPSLDSAYNFWLRNEAGSMIESPTGIPELVRILQKRLLRPTKIRIRDHQIYRFNFKLCPEMGRVRDLITQTVSPTATKGVSVSTITRSLIEHTGLDVTYLRFGDERREAPDDHPCYVGIDPNPFTDNTHPGNPIVREATLDLAPEYEGLETRFLNLHSADINLDRGEPTPSYWLQRLFYEAPNLKTLSLCVYIQPLGHWRTGNPVVPKLTEFYLHATTISAADLLAMLASSEETLTYTHLKLVTLLGEWCSVLSSLAKRYPKLGSFRFGALRENSDAGSSISFWDAQTLIPEECRQNLRMIKKGLAPHHWSNMVSYEGPDTAKVLDILSSCVKPKSEPPRAA